MSKETSPKHILVVGGGSVGKRHLRNFTSLGCQVSVLDPRPNRREEAAATVPLIYQYTHMDEVISNASEFSGVVVGSPTKFHVEQASLALQNGLPVLLEKPMSVERCLGGSVV